MTTFDPALVESFKRARAIYYEGRGSIRKLAKEISVLKMAARENYSDVLEFYKEHFAGRMVDALLDEDWKFLERLLLAAKSGPELSSVPEWEDCVFVAFRILYERGREIQKLDVQKLAKRWRVINAQRIKGADPFTLGPERVEKEIQKAIDALHEPVWTRIFKRCGLEDLPKNPGGRKPANALQKRKKTIYRKRSTSVDSLKS